MAVHDPRDPDCFYAPWQASRVEGIVCKACKLATRELPIIKEPS